MAFRSKGRLSVYHAEQARLQREEQERQRRAAQQIEDARRLELAAAMEAEAVAVDDPTLLAEAQAVLDAPLVVAAPVLAPATPSVRGVTYRDTWTYVVRDEAKIPRSWFILDEKRLAAHVRANKDKTDVPGIEAFCEKTVVASAAVQG
jgi:hypothetical protein